MICILYIISIVTFLCMKFIVKKKLDREYSYARVMGQIKFAVQCSNLIINMTFGIITDIIHNYIGLPMITPC